MLKRDFQDRDDRYMRRALDLARRGRSWVAPNPLVGAVIVRNGSVLGEGWHERYGGPHAETNAVLDARKRGFADLRGATLYVTLEPCSHSGKTPPCADLVVERGISRVVYGMEDPNPLVSGRGLRRLREAGIRTDGSALEDDCRALNRAFVKHVSTGLPLVILKTALSLDGKTASSSGESRWITGEESRGDVHRLRMECGAVLCGIGTVLADNPSLTVRLDGNAGFRPPVRVVADSRFRVPEGCALVQTAREVPTWVAAAENAFAGPTAAEAERKRAALEAAGVAVITVPAAENPDKGGDYRLDLRALAGELGKRGVNAVLLEGGATLASGALEAGIVDMIRYYLAPTLLGGAQAAGAIGGRGCGALAAAWRVEGLTAERIGPDLVLEGRVDYSGRLPCSPG